MKVYRMEHDGELVCHIDARTAKDAKRIAKLRGFQQKLTATRAMDWRF